jgi:hypothetical protein
MNLIKTATKDRLFWMSIISLICLTPFWFFYNQIFEFKTFMYLLSKLDRILLLIISTALMFKINWCNAYKTHTLIINSTFATILLGFVNSFIFNSGYLFNYGFLNELIPLFALSIFFVYSSQHKFGTKSLIQPVLIITALMIQLLIIVRLAFNTEINNIYKINLDYLGILGLYLAGIILHYACRTDSKIVSLVSKPIIICTVGLTLLYSTTLFITGLFGVFVFTLKNKNPNLNATKPLVLGLCIITLVSGLSTSFISSSSLKSSISQTTTQLIQHSGRLLIGYGIGSIGEKSEFNFGNNYDKFNNRPIIQDYKGPEKSRVISTPIWILQLIINGGVLYTIAYLTVLTVVLLSYRRDDWIFAPLLMVFLFSFVFNPLNFIPLFTIIIITPLLIEQSYSNYSTTSS